MTWIEAALWGLGGGFAVEGLDLYGVLRRHGCWPWQLRGPREVGAVGYFVAELIRLVIGGVLASALAESNQIPTAFGALAVGVAAPLIVERLTRVIPLPDSVQHKHTSLMAADKWPPTASESEPNSRRVTVDAQHAGVDEAEKITLGDQSDWVGE